MRKITTSLLIVFLAMGVIAQTKKEYFYLIIGEAVDENRKPVPFAGIGITALPNHCCDVDGYIDKADKNGNIHFQVLGSQLSKRDRLFYLTGAIPGNAVAPISLPFDEYQWKTAPQLKPRRIKIKRNGQVDLGKVVIETFYGVVEVLLRDSSDKPLFTEYEPWRYLFIRVTDAEDKVVTNVNVSNKETKKGVNVATSSMRIALPEGVWKLAISFENENGPWLTNNELIKIERNKNLQILLKASDTFK